MSQKKRRRRRRRNNNNKIAAVILAGAVLVFLGVAFAVRSARKQEPVSNQSDSPSTTGETIQTTESAGNGESAATADASQNHTETSGSSQEVTAKGFSIQLIDGITYVDGVLIANKTYGLPEDYAPGDLTDEVKAAFEVLQSAAAKEGLNLYISSGYRSYTRQQTLYNNYVSKDGKEKADTYSARAGHSEHQSGLCFDLNTIDDSFANTPESKWLEKHAQEYGFIIRYPKGKEPQTGYQYEPWHLRYLGVDLATKVYNSGLCLEEYYGITSEYAE